jgi:hypothetical protein
MTGDAMLLLHRPSVRRWHGRYQAERQRAAQLRTALESPCPTRHARSRAERTRQPRHRSGLNTLGPWEFPGQCR